MIPQHIISSELRNILGDDHASNHHWLAYNTNSYFLDKGDVYSFKNKEEAIEFAENNISEYDLFAVININQFIQQFNKTVMNEKNFDYLKNQVKFTGFGEGLENDLKEKLAAAEPRFALFHQAAFGRDSTIATLQFKKSDESDMYFFNSYSLALKNDQHPDAIKQTFYISNKDENITLKEAYNLLSGRAVHKELSNKEGEKYTAWLQMDFKEMDKNGNYKVKQFHQNYGYKLEETLSKHPIKELGIEQDKMRLLESLERGNRQSVTLVKNGEEQKVFIEASPQFKGLNFYDANMQRMKAEQISEKKTTEQSVKQEVKETAKQDGKQVQKAGAQKKNVQKNGKKRQGMRV